MTPLCASTPSEKRSKAVKKATELHSNKTPAVIPMARAVKDIQREIRELSSEDKVELIRTLIADLDAPADSNVERGLAGNITKAVSGTCRGKSQRGSWPSGV